MPDDNRKQEPSNGTWRDPLDDLISPILNHKAPVNTASLTASPRVSGAGKRDPLDDLLTEVESVKEVREITARSSRPKDQQKRESRRTKPNRVRLLLAILMLSLGLAALGHFRSWWDSELTRRHIRSLWNSEPNRSVVPRRETTPPNVRPIATPSGAFPTHDKTPEPAANSEEFLTPEELFARVSPSVVRVNVFDARSEQIAVGSGFFIRDDSTLVTNHHVMEGADSAEVVLSDGTKYKVFGWEAVDPAADIVLLYVKHHGAWKIQPLSLADTLPQVASKVFAIGAPAGLDNSFSDGSVSGLREGWGRQWIQMTAPISPGSSGGPVFNERGLVIGMATSFVVRGQNLNFAIAARHIQEMIPKGQIALPVKLSILPTPNVSKQSPKVDNLDPINPRDDEEILKEVERHISAGVMRRALQVLDDVPDDKRGPEYWRVRARALFSITAYREAADCYFKSLKLDNSDFDTWFRYALAVYLRPKDELAVAEWRQRRPLQPLLQSYVDDDLVLAACRSALKIDPNDCRPYQLMGLSLRNDEERIDALKTALSLDNDDIGVHFQLGCAFAVKRKDDARKHFKKAVDLVGKVGANVEVINPLPAKDDGRRGWEDKLDQFSERNSLDVFLKLNLAATHDEEGQILICREVLRSEPKNRVATHMLRKAMKLTGRIRSDPNEYLFTPPESWGALSLSSGTTGILILRK